ncbi:SpvB/TcaC N-terminal domain-containing protein [Phaeocystidibacter luteus]|uniref:Insecticide toxin TcdB middle/N-terminal domain-containing protein n=1 Tax=Phaeocystidibacter luteus TaxID=911197 RepID=A0A6N6RKD3_9FLAO|nr:SpvB/TcaC N-terminal domain-containing protein [Phaeocystidibacter luteus]KAB2805371.1 hypothetical protein F8C67_13630 [Phaeocystidibacter luteus]
MKVDFISRLAAVTLCFLFMSPDLFALSRTLSYGIPHMEEQTNYAHVPQLPLEVEKPENMELLAEAGHAYLGGHTNDPHNRPEDDVFQVELDVEETKYAYAFLKYEALGLANPEDLPKSINGSEAYGSQELDIAPDWKEARVRIEMDDLRSGVNSIRFMLPEGLHFPVEVRNVSLELQEENPERVLVQDDIVRRPANSIDFEVLTENVRLRGYKVSQAEAASIPRHIVNVTRRSYAYHLDGSESQGYHIAIGVDASKVRSQSEMNEVQVFYFDDLSKSWKSAHVMKVDHANLRVEAMVPGETDYFAGLIQTPEMPEAGAFVPTNISDIEPANPATGMRLIQAPTANRQGSANISYPLWVPQGRNGMTPQLALNYSSDGSSGWCGLGWSISVPSISVDTRLGVPRFDENQETEGYVYNGQELFLEGGRRPNRADNGGNSMLRQSNSTNGIRFFTRTVSSYSEIVRHGANPDEYYWIVTDSDNKKFYYGTYNGSVVSSNGVLASNEGVSTWYLTKVEDKWGNTMTYEYEQTPHSSSSTDLKSDGISMTLSKITYTGYAEDAGAYTVHFITSTNRVDTRISMNQGLKVVDDKRLDRVEVKYNGTDVVHYHLRYNQDYTKDPVGTIPESDRFFKTLLTEVAEQRDFTAGGVDFYSHKFDYHKGTYGFNSTEDYILETNLSAPWLNNAPEWAQEILSPITSYVVPSGINTSLTGGISGSGSVGLGFQLFPIPNKTSTLSAKFGFSGGNTWSTRMFQDVSGDGLPDLIYKGRDGFNYRALNRRSDGSYYFGNRNDIEAEHLQKFSQRGVNVSLDFVAEANLLYYGSNWSWSSNETKVSMTDYNGDGVLDLITKTGGDYRVKFGQLQSNGDLTFAYSSESTHNPVLKASDVTLPDFEGVPTKAFETVRVWEASVAGTIQIRGAASIYGQNSGEVRVAVQKNGQFIYPGNTFGSNGAIAFKTVTPTSPQVMSYDIVVQKGDQIFFRIQAGEDGQQDFVQWNPVVKYTSSNHVDGNGTQFWLSSYNAGFLLSGREPVWFNGGDQVKVIPGVQTLNAALGDELQLKIELYNEEGKITEYIQQVNAGSTSIGTSFNSAPFINAYHSFNGSFGINSSDKLYMVFSAWSTSTVDWKRIKWRPEIHVLDVCADYPDRSYPVVDIQTYNRIKTLNGPVGFSLPSNDYEVSVELDDYTASSQQTELENIFDELKTDYRELVYMTVKSGGTAISHKAVSFEYYHQGTHIVRWYDLNPDLSKKNQLSNETFNGSSSATFNSGDVQNGEIWIEFHGKGPFADGITDYLNQHVRSIGAYSMEREYFSLEGSVNIYYRGIDNLQSQYKYWGQFGWGTPDGEENVAIQPSELITPAMEELENGADFNDESYLANTTANLDPMDMKFVPMFAARGEKHTNLRSYQIDYAKSGQTWTYSLLDRWSVMGSHISVFDAYGMSFPGIYGESEDEADDFTVPGGLDPTYTAFAMPNRTKSYSKAENGPGGGFVNTSTVVNDPSKYFSRTVGYFGDLNGDGFPDVVSENTNGSIDVQYTNPTGGHVSSKNLTSISELNKSNSDNSTIAPNGTFINNIPKFEELNLPNASVSFGSSFTLNSLADINGDGLPDQTIDGVGISLNSGYDFDAPINAPYAKSIANNSSFSFGVSSALKDMFEVVPTWAKSFSAGINVNFVGNDANTFYMDFNGDGLQDRMVLGQNNSANLFINTGTTYQLYNAVTTQESYNLSRGMGFSGNLTGNYAFSIPFGPKISVGGSVNGNLSVNRVRTSFVDMNGDGDMDFIHSLDNGNMAVYLAKSEKANLLNTVTNPLGGTISIDYELIGNKVGYYDAEVKTHVSNDDVEKVIWDMPTAKWVMSEVTVDDGFDLISSGSADVDGTDEYVTKFAYDGGIKNRREKNFVGFTRFAIIHPDQLEGGQYYLSNPSPSYGIAARRLPEEIDPSIENQGGVLTEIKLLEVNILNVEVFSSPNSLEPHDILEWTFTQNLKVKSLQLHRHYWEETFRQDPNDPIVWLFEHIELISENSYDYEYRQVDIASGSPTAGQVKLQSSSPVVIEDLSTLGETSSIFPAVISTEDVSFPDISERTKYLAHKYEIEYDEYFNVIRYKDFGESQPGAISKVQVGTYSYYEYEYKSQQNSCDEIVNFEILEGAEYAPFVGLVVESNTPGFDPAVAWYIPEPISGCFDPAEVPYPNSFCVGEGDDIEFTTVHRKQVLREVPIYEYNYATVYTGALIAEMEYFDPTNANGRTSALREHKIYEGSTAGNPIRHSEVASLWSNGAITNAAPSELRQYYGTGTSDYSVTDLEYDEYGNVDKITGPPNTDGVRAHRVFNYDSGLNQFVTSVQNHIGETVCNVYDFGPQQLLQTTGPNGHPIRYAYDENDRLAQVWAPRELYDGTQGPTVSFEYYPYGKSGSSVTNPAPVAITYHNTGNSGTTVEFRDESNLDEYCSTLHAIPSSTMANSVGTATFVDGLDRPMQVKTEVDVTNSFGGSSERLRVSGIVEYDRFGHVVATRQDFLSNETPVDLGNFIWDVSSSVSPVIGTSTHDYAGRKQTEDVAWSGTGTSTPDMTTITYGYYWASDLGYTEYSGKDYFAQEVSQDGTSQISYSDSRGNGIATKTDDGTNHILTQFDFDNLGQLLKVVTPMSQTGAPIEVDYVYDMFGRVLSEDHPDRGLSTTTYDKASNILITTTPEGRIEYEFDQYGRIEKKLFKETVAPYDPSISSGLYDVLYEYGAADGSDSRNGVGRLIRATQGSTSNPVLVEDFKYDELGNTTWNKREFNIPKNGAETFITQSFYDSFGRVLKLKYPDDEYVNYSYSNLGSLRSITTNFASMPSESIIDMIHYDGFDNITRIEYGNGTSTDFEYHEFTRSLMMNKTEAKASSGTFAQVHQKEFTYNSRGLITSVDAEVDEMMFGASKTQVYTFDFSYDDFNRLTQADLTDKTNSTHYSAYSVGTNFDAAGRITSKSSAVLNPGNSDLVATGTGMDYTRTYTYSAGSHQLSNLTDPNNVAWHQNLQYNDAGSIEKIEEWNAVTSSYDETVFVWNEQEQLVAVSDPNSGIHHYVYDYNGTRIMKSSYLESTLSVDDQDVGTRTNLDPYSLYVNEYYVRKNFADGFQKTKHYYMGMQRVVSDITLQEVAPPEGPGMKNELNDTETLDSSIEEEMGSAGANNPVIDHLVHVLAGLGEIEGEDFVIEDLVKSETLESQFPQFSSQSESAKVGHYAGEWECCFEGVRYWYHPDYLGSVDMITDESGTVYQYFLYNPWGEELNSYSQPNGEFSSPYRFNGKELDEETGLAYYGARYYDNQLSMWLSVDPLGMDESNVSKTPYHFSSGNPIMRLDPDGRKDVIFNEDGTYRETINDNWWHNLWNGTNGIVKNSDGETMMEFKFNDSKDAERFQLDPSDKDYLEGIDMDNDISDLRDEIVDSRIENIQNSTDGHFSVLRAVYDESLSSGALDMKNEPDAYKLHIIDGVGYNDYDAGNWLWGYAVSKLGVYYWEAKLGSEFNGFWNGKLQNDQYQPGDFFLNRITITGDSAADQRAIRAGHRAHNRN